MRISSLLNPEKRAVFRMRNRKKFHLKRAENSIPVMLLGAQRSGTSMLMQVFELHPETEVLTELANSRIYSDYRLRDLETVRRAVVDSWAPFVCFKPLADSHLARRLIETFPDGRFAWVDRHYRDVALSRLSAFENADRAIRIVCEGGSGGGWFQEGVSAETSRILRALPYPQFSQFDFACLVWWARNRLFIEQRLGEMNNLILIRYESLLDGDLQKLFEFIGLSYDKSLSRFVRRPRMREDYPSIHPHVKALCGELERQLEHL